MSGTAFYTVPVETFTETVSDTSSIDLNADTLVHIENDLQVLIGLAVFIVVVVLCRLGYRFLDIFF